MITRTFKLCLNAGTGSAPFINVNQYDEGETWLFELYSETGERYIPTTGAIVGVKSDGHGIANTGTVDSEGRVVITETEQMTAAAGKAEFELLIENQTHGTANFVVDVEQRAGENAIPSESDLSLIQQAVDSAAEIEDLLDGQDVPTVITPIITDWLDDNITNPSNPPIDTSLTVAGAAADAKATGDEISDLKSAFDTGYLTIHHDITWQSGWIRNNGNVEASSVSRYAVVPVEKGEIVEIGTNSANMCIIGSTTAESVSVGDTVTVIQSTGSSGSYETHVYEAPSDMTLVLCVRASNYSLNFTKRSEALIAVEQEVAEELENLTVTSDMIDGNETVREQIENVSTKDAYYYYRSTSATLASMVGSNAIGVIVSLSEFVSDDIEFDWDSSLNHSQQPIMLTVGNVEGTSVVAYWSAYEIVNASQNFQNYGGYYDSVNKKVHLSLSEITTRKPTAQYLVVSMNTTISHGVYTYVPQTRKQLKWLIASGAVPSIVVASDGSGDYTTISEAVGNAENGDTIYIKDGEYKETVIINKYVHLVGQSKQGTVLYQNIGDYDNCPLLITQGSVCNMTIKSLAPADTSGLTDYAYAIHLDKNFASEAKYQKCEIYNCDIYSEVNDAIGAGTNYASEYDIHDCLLHVAHNPVKTGSCGFKCHNGQNQTTGKVTLRNNVIMTEDANGTSCYDILYHNGGISNTQPIDILMVGNVLKYYHNGITNIFVPSAYNYGNSVSAMNTL